MHCHCDPVWKDWLEFPGYCYYFDYFSQKRSHRISDSGISGALPRSLGFLWIPFVLVWRVVCFQSLGLRYRLRDFGQDYHYALVLHTRALCYAMFCAASPEFENMHLDSAPLCGEPLTLKHTSSTYCSRYLIRLIMHEHQYRQKSLLNSYLGYMHALNER